MAAKHHGDTKGQPRNRIGVPYSQLHRTPAGSRVSRHTGAQTSGKFEDDDGLPPRAVPQGLSSSIVNVESALARDGSVRKRARRQVAIAILALLLGALCIAYPFVSDAVNQSREQQVIEAVSGLVSDTDEDTLAAEREKAVEYNRQLLDGRAVVTDPFDPDAERPTDEDYDSVMNLAGDGVMGTINIPAIHVELPIYHSVDDDVLEHGVGHLEGTSVPIGGESTHCVLSGHTGLPSMKIFDNLDQLKEGDYFVLSVLGEDHAYRITSIETVLPDETDSLVIEEGRDLCTLVTCTPYGVNTHRLLVHSERCEVPEEWLDKGDADFPAGYSEPPDKALLPSVLLGLLLAFVVIGGYTGISKLRARRAEARAAEEAALRGAAAGGAAAVGSLKPLAGPLPGNPCGRSPGPDAGLADSAAKASAPVIPAGRDRRTGAGGGVAGAVTPAGGSHAAGGVSRASASHAAHATGAASTAGRPAGKRFKPVSDSSGASAGSSQPATGSHGKRPDQGSPNPRGHHFR